MNGIILMKDGNDDHGHDDDDEDEDEDEDDDDDDDDDGKDDDEDDALLPNPPWHCSPGLIGWQQNSWAKVQLYQ